MHGTASLKFYLYVLNKYDLYRRLRVQFLILLMMGAVTSETCRVTLQWINICILLHLLDFYSHWITMHGTTSLKFYLYVLNKYDLYRRLRVQFLILLMMGAVTSETCRVTLQWINICILLHLLDFYSHYIHVVFCCYTTQRGWQPSSLAHHLCTIWIFYEPRRVTLGNTRHFVEE